LGVGYYAGCGFLRNRIVFPIHDQEGQLVAYAGRSLDGGQPRYLFPPGFHKSQVVFNLRRAVGKSAGCALVVEGFFDCLRVHQAGYRKVVAWNINSTARHTAAAAAVFGINTPTAPSITSTPVKLTIRSARGKRGGTIAMRSRLRLPPVSRRRQQEHQCETSA
jgi:hypothetical protein